MSRAPASKVLADVWTEAYRDFEQYGRMQPTKLRQYQ